MKKPKLKKLLSPNPDWLLKESDAGRIMLGCAVLDKTLQLMHTFFIRSNTMGPSGYASQKFLDELFGDTKPLGTFSAKIKLAYAYGLIVRDDYDCLEAMRELRNEAAHVPFQYHLNDEGLKPMLARVVKHDKTKKLFESSRWTPQPPREKAIVVSAVLALWGTLQRQWLEMSDRRPGVRSKK